MRMFSIIVLSCFLAATAAREASASFQIRHFPLCPADGVEDKKTCECRAFVDDPLSHLSSRTTLPSQCLSRHVLVDELRV